MINVYVSGITDMRDIAALLNQSGHEWQRVEMGMSSGTQRERFRQLKSQYDWSSLPMIVADGQLIGGAPELRDWLPAQDDGTGAPQWALWMGYGGLIPFVGLTALTLTGALDHGLEVTTLLLTYAAIILSFVGAVQWGLAVANHRGPSNPSFVGSVVPALFAWLTLTVPATIAALVFSAGFAGWYGWERMTIWTHYPDWFRQLRTHLTVVACISLIVAGLIGMR